MKNIASGALSIILLLVLAAGSSLASAQNASPSTPVTTQVASPATSVPNVATKSDVQKLRQELRRNTAKESAQVNSAITAATQKIETDQKVEAKKLQETVLAQQRAEEERDAENARRLQLREEIFGVAAVAILLIVIMIAISRKQKANDRANIAPVEISPQRSLTAEDLYGKTPTPLEVRKCIEDCKLNDALFTVELPADHLMFEYRARRMPDGNVVAYFKGNDRPVALELQKLRKVAKLLYANGVLQPVKALSEGAIRAK